MATIGEGLITSFSDIAALRAFKQYSDASYNYYCQADPCYNPESATHLAYPVWRIHRVALDGTTIRFALSGAPMCNATNIATVQAYFA
jgi:hypothetical protein